MIKHVSIVGMGCLGIMYGHFITKKIGTKNVDFIVNEARFERYSQKKITCNKENVSINMVKEDEAGIADLVIIAIKDYDLQSALNSIKNAVGKETIIISVMNGISSEEIISEGYPQNQIIPTVAQGMDATRVLDDLTYTKMGALHIGATDEKQEYALKELKDFFSSIDFPHVVEDDIMYRMWCKFMLNVGVNQVAAAYKSTYGEVLGTPIQREELVKAMEEVVQIAQKKGLPLTGETINEYIRILETLSPQGRPSMCQDVLAKRETEVEMFAGTVNRMGKALGVQTPMNEILYNRLK